jgi:excisionase family DNA binding protein
MPPRPLTAAEAATRLGITLRAIQQAAKRGRLKARRHGMAWLIMPNDLAKYAASRQWTNADRKAP